MKTTYNEKIEVLEMVLNGRLTKPTIAKFKTTLGDMESQHQTSLSTMFLRNLINSPNRAKKWNVIHNILKRGEYKTEQKQRHFKEFDQFGNTIKTKETLKFLIA